MRYAVQICEAVDYAHKRHMIHRDIKPANIMLDLNGQAILMDFGIAKIIGGQQHTATGAVVGTALYMSPEQIRSERFDHRTDIYSIGVTLFELVHGRPPFEADSTMSLMMMHLNEPTPDLRKLRPEIPTALVDVIEKAMEKEPGARYQSAAEMAAALRRALASAQASTTGMQGEKVQVFASTMRASATRAATAGSAPKAALQSGASIFSGGLSSAALPAAPTGRPRRNAVLAGGCVVILLAAVCFVGGGAVLFNQLIAPGRAAAGPAVLFAAT
jgi:serine/threonine-protein kinase